MNITQMKNMNLFTSMYRMMERNRIYTMATVILKEKNSLQTNYKEKVRESAEETKVAIGKIKSQMDTAIKGQVKKKVGRSDNGEAISV